MAWNLTDQDKDVLHKFAEAHGWDEMNERDLRITLQGLLHYLVLRLGKLTDEEVIKVCFGRSAQG